jgi:hypothetical protein
MKTIIINEEIFEVTEKTYKKVSSSSGVSKRILIRKDWWEKKQQKCCDVIRKEGKKIGEVDLILRDD